MIEWIDKHRDDLFGIGAPVVLVGSICLLALACAQAPPEPPTFMSPECTKWQERDVTTCTSNDHWLAGGLTGLFVAGPIGAIAGAAIGSGDKQTCSTGKEKVCVASEYVSRPNPRYVGAK